MRWLLSAQNNKYIVFILFLVGLTLRLWGIKQDLPYDYYGDESYLIYHSLKFGTGDLNPHWFVWPTFFQYILFFLFGIFYVLGLVLGWFRNTADFLYFYLKDPTIFFLIGRVTTAILGTASIFLVYLIAKKSYNKETGLISACLFTFLPLSVEYSHYAVVDTPLVFMILLSLIFIINVLLSARLKDYLLSGFFSGLALGTKYPAALLIMPIFLTHLFSYHGKGFIKTIFNQKIVLCFLFIFLGFFLACPFAILDFSKFIPGIKTQYIGAKIGWFGWEKTNPYTYHLSQNLKNAMGLPLLLFTIFSLFYAVKQKKKIDLILSSFVIIYFLLIGLDKNTYARFMLPMLPILAIFSGRFLLDLKRVLFKRYRNSGIFFSGFFIFLLFNPVYTSIKTDLNFTLPNTMTIAKEWVEKNIPAGSKILLNEYAPSLFQSPNRIRHYASQKPEGQLRYTYYKKRDLFYKIKEKIAAQSLNYELTYISHPIGYLEGDYGYEQMILGFQEAIKDYKEKYDFIIISDASLHRYLTYSDKEIPQKYLFLKYFYVSLKNFNPIKVFSPQKGLVRGPTIKVFKIGIENGVPPGLKPIISLRLGLKR